MRSRRALLGMGSALALSLAGCASPPVHYYRLAVVPGATSNGGPPAIELRNISIPGYLDRNGIAMPPHGDHQFETSDNDRWAELLADMLQAIMVQDLGQRLPTSTVIGSGSAIGVPVKVLIEIAILRFDPDSMGRVILDAQIAVRPRDSQAIWLTRNINIRSAPVSGGSLGIATAMSTVWAMAADQIAGLVVKCWADGLAPKYQLINRYSSPPRFFSYNIAIKTGSLCRSECIAKYNRLLETDRL